MSAPGVIPAVADAVRRYANYLRSDGRRRRGLFNAAMAPWDENNWFENPVQNDFTGDNNTNAFRILGFNMRRVGIIFSNRGPQTMLVSINGTGTTSGFILNPTTNPFPLIQSEHGNLVQVEWFAYGLGVGAWGMSATEIILRDWPMR